MCLHGPCIHSRRVDTVSANSRTFDAVFSCRGGVDYSFSNLSKEDLPSIENFLREKKINFQNELVAKKPAFKDDVGSGSESEGSLAARSGDEDESSTDEDYQEGDDETSGSGSGPSSGEDEASAVEDE